MKAKTIEVDLGRLTQYVADNCSYLTFSSEGSLLCRNKINATCRLSVYEREQCPRDCPHMNEAVKWACDKEKCNYVKKIIKTLKAE